MRNNRIVMSLLTCLCLLQPLVLPAQQQPAPAPPATMPKFTSSTQLVVETVSVKDKNGNPIEGLTAKDFTVTENGVPQTISFCEFQKLTEAAEPAAAAPAAPRPARRRRRSRRSRRSPDTQIAPRSPGRYQITATAACSRSTST